MNNDGVLDLNKSSLGDLNSMNRIEANYEDGSFAEDLQKRCELLVRDLEEFQNFVKSHKTEHTVELRTFKNDIQNELKLLNRLVSLLSKPTSPTLLTPRAGYHLNQPSKSHSCSQVFQLSLLRRCMGDCKTLTWHYRPQETLLLGWPAERGSATTASQESRQQCGRRYCF